ncbi:SubName: Full=Uncharacterized protein {ECO:0000313/EMBL:CCA76779.1} [Serendipita indica DSM 11827]|nr:SubName: Full=Uncharacterized protein {ECO:0000313/EMBL:CCA76779.1} [Serendipita indica DSM 11827]
MTRSVYGMESVLEDSSRDSSFVRLELYPDENASDIDAPDVPFHQVFYGQLLYIVKVTLKK